MQPIEKTSTLLTIGRLQSSMQVEHIDLIQCHDIEFVDLEQARLFAPSPPGRRPFEDYAPCR